MSVDPIIGDVADSQSVNPFSYVGNRPLSYVDPSGLEACADSYSCTAEVIYYVYTILKDFGLFGGGHHAPPPPIALPGTSAQTSPTPCTGGSFVGQCGNGAPFAAATPGFNPLGLSPQAAAEAGATSSSPGSGGQHSSDVMAQIASASDVLVSRHGRPTPRKPKVAPTSLPEAKAVYGETGGLFPQKNDPSRSIYNPGNWNPTSLRQLTIARIWIAEVQRRNSNVNYAELNGSKLIDVIQWNMALGAASAASNSSPAGVRHFFIRPTIDGRTRPPFVGTKEPLATFGPFVNVGGGDVARGDNIYIDFYENIP